MIRKDFHGTLAHEALQEVDLVVGNVRNAGRSEEAEFITGFGVIRTQLFQLLEDYSLSPRYKHGNEGTVVVLIE